MQIEVVLMRWIEVLAGLLTDLRDLSQARKSVVVTREDDCFTLRRAGAAADQIITKVAPGTQVPGEIALNLRNNFITFELSPDKLVKRRINVPLKAQEFLPGIVRNQIERLSPWPPAQAFYNFATTPSADDPGMLNVCVQIAARSNVEAIRDELTASGLAPNRISIAADADTKAPALTLWTRPVQGTQRKVQSLPQMIMAGLAGLVLLSVGTSAWALYSANAISAEHDDVVEQTQALERQGRSRHRPEDIALMKPVERAWALKETSPATVMVLDDLTRALPDSAYLTELNLENTRLRIIGSATDAPSLIAALEKSGRFSGVHFYAPTTKAPDGSLYKFYIEARTQSDLEPKGE